MAARIAIIGLGKIARDQHAPAIAANPDFMLAATAGGQGTILDAVPHFACHRALLTAARDSIDAVAICTPPGPRYTIARDCLAAGLDVLLEKPPCATLGEVEALAAAARASGSTVFAAWHSQFSPGVAAARQALAGRTVCTISIDWLESVRRWHPGQDWALAAGGFGTLDAGINAISIATRILPMPLIVATASLLTPENRQAPIAADISFASNGSHARFDWRVTEERRAIRVETEGGGGVLLDAGGTQLTIDGVAQTLGGQREYPLIYARFAELIRTRTSDVDREPLRVVADAFMVGEHRTVEPFAWDLVPG